MLVPLPTGPDLRFDAAPVARVVAELSRTSGERLAVAPDVAKEIVAVRLPAKGADAALARGLNATWTLRDGCRVLVRTGEQRAQERRAADAAQLRALRNWVSSPSLPSFDAEGYADARELLRAEHRPEDIDRLRHASEVVWTKSPEKRLALRLKATLDPVSLLVAVDTSAVFHSTPNPRQRPLTPAMVEAFHEYRAELTLAGEAAEKVPSALEVILDADAGDVSLRFRTLDAQGSPLTGDRTDGSHEHFGFAAELQERGPEKRLATPDPWGLGEHSRVPIGIWERLLNVAHTDPLEPLGAWLARCAEARHESLVAVLGDEILNRLPYGSVAPGGFLRDLTLAEYAAREEGGTLWIAPVDRAATRARQADRVAMGEWLAHEREGRPLSMADRLRLTRYLPLAGDDWALTGWLRDIGVTDSGWNAPFVRLAGRLPRGTMLLADLAPEVEDALRNMVLRVGPADLRTHLDGVCGTGWETREDATDRLPNGVPPNAFVRVEEFRIPCYVDSRPPPREFPSQEVMTVEALDGHYLLAPDEVRIGTCHRLDLTVDLGGGRLYQYRIEAVENLGPPVPPSALRGPLGSAFRRAQARSASAP